MEFISEHKWQLLIGLETTAWIFTFLMFYTRYWLKSKTLFNITTTIAVITGWFPHISLAILDFYQTRKITIFELFIVVLLLYGFTLGKKHISMLDKKMYKLANKNKAEK